MKAKVVLKNRAISSFGGIYQVEDLFNRLFSGLIDSSLGTRCPLRKGFQYSDVFRTVCSIYLCGGDHIEDITTHLGKELRLRPKAVVPSSDTICRALKSLACENTKYASESGMIYEHNEVDKMNKLLLDMLSSTGQLKSAMEVTLDFDHEFIPAEKYDAKFSYKKRRGYFPAVATIGGMIVGVENRDGNSNVKFHQADTLERFFIRLEDHDIKVNRYRADCGSYSKDIVQMVNKHSNRFYLRASNCQSRKIDYEACEKWKSIEINHERLEVASFEFSDFMEEEKFRLVVQRQEVKPAGAWPDLFGKRHIYRAILTNDHEMNEKEIICFYNARGACERNFDVQNNDFGWAHLPFSFMRENSVFMLLTAMVKNFYLYVVELLSRLGAKGLKPTSRLKRLIFTFIAVPAQWVRAARSWKLNIFTTQSIYIRFGELT